jgi:integrase/recombinase XerD
MSNELGLQARLQQSPEAQAWLAQLTTRGLSPSSVGSYRKALARYLAFCDREGIDPLHARRVDLVSYMNALVSGPSLVTATVAAAAKGATGPAPATATHRRTVVRLFYDYLVDTGVCEQNPVGGGKREQTPRTTAAWIPTDDQWVTLVDLVRREPVRNRLMFSLVYDGALRREELASLRMEDIDEAAPTIRVRAETSRGGLKRAVSCSATTAWLLAAYLEHRETLAPRRGELFVSESRSNRGDALRPNAWSHVAYRIGIRAQLPEFSPHTPRNVRLVDLARTGLPLADLARFAGYRTAQSALVYQRLAKRLSDSPEHAAISGNTDRLSRLGLDVEPG